MILKALLLDTKYISLLRDENWNIYAWGMSKIPQFGIGTDGVRKPRFIGSLSKYDIDIIKYGESHYIFKTVNNEYYAFGCNKYCECIGSFGDDYLIKISNPLRIDTILKEKYNIKSIIDIIPGYFNTTVICTK